MQIFKCICSVDVEILAEVCCFNSIHRVEQHPPLKIHACARLVGKPGRKQTRDIEIEKFAFAQSRKITAGWYSEPFYTASFTKAGLALLDYASQTHLYVIYCSENWTKSGENMRISDFSLPCLHFANQPCACASFREILSNHVILPAGKR